jgi:hypothetical protein
MPIVPLRIPEITPVTLTKVRKLYLSEAADHVHWGSERYSTPVDVMDELSKHIKSNGTPVERSKWGEVLDSWDLTQVKDGSLRGPDLDSADTIKILEAFCDKALLSITQAVLLTELEREDLSGVLKQHAPHLISILDQL